MQPEGTIFVQLKIGGKPWPPSNPENGQKNEAKSGILQAVSRAGGRAGRIEIPFEL